MTSRGVETEAVRVPTVAGFDQAELRVIARSLDWLGLSTEIGFTAEEIEAVAALAGKVKAMLVEVPS